MLAAVGLIASLTFRDYGLGWDDYTHAEYADLLLRMYGSGFKDTGALSFANLYMYGGGFDMAAALLHKVIPLELFETRRLLGAVVGVIGLAVTWRLGRRVGGPLAGLAALLLLALCPTFYGHMFMNPKDAPFAVAMVILMLGLVRLAEEYPAPSPRTILIVGLGAGLSLGSRVLGGLALVYALVGFVPLFLEEIRTHGAREAVRRFAHVAYVLLPGLILGYLVMGLIWPWSIMEPGNPFRALTYFSHFFEKPWKEMFDGALVSVPDMPWSYLPTLFALQLPEVLLALVHRRRRRHAGSAVARRRIGPPQDHPVDADAGGDAAAGDRDGEASGALQRHSPFHLRDSADDGARRRRVRLGNELAQGQSPQLAARRGGRFLVRPAVAAQRDDPAAPLPVHPLQSHRRHGTRPPTTCTCWITGAWRSSRPPTACASNSPNGRKRRRSGRKWKVAVCGPQRPAQVALGPDFTIGWDSHAADFAMTLGEFYCKGLTAPVMVEIKRDDVVFARVYDIRGRSISSLLAIPAP